LRNDANLSEFPVVFCDSLKALQQARAKGLRKNARVVTSAPEVYFEGSGDVESLFQRKPKGHLRAFMEAGGDLTREVFIASKKNAEIREYALVVARVVHKVHQQLTKISALETEDFLEPRLVILVDTGNDKLNEVLNPTISRFLDHNPAAAHRTYPISGVRENWGKEPMQYRVSIAISGLVNSIPWKLGKMLSLIWPNRPQLMFVLGGHLVREAVTHMMFSGYAVQHVARDSKEFARICLQGPQEPFPENILASIEKIVEPGFHSMLSSWIHPLVHRRSWDLARQLLHEELGKFHRARLGWRSELLNRNPEAAFVGPPMRSEMLGMIAACKERGIPTVSGQHGVSREIEDTFERCRSVFYENSAVDLLLCYNRRSVAQNNASVFKTGASTITGLSKDYYRARRPTPISKKHPVLFVSTALLSGGVNMLKGGFDDIQRVRVELDLIDKVLGKMPYGVKYKSYHFGTARYAETGIVERRASMYENIQIFDEPVELADFFPTRYRLIITARATSTMAWCLMSKKPLILIDIPQDSPLQTEVKAKLAEAIFLFSLSDNDFHQKLLKFCCQDIRAIEDQWKEKEVIRQKFISEYVEGPGNDSGRRAGTAVTQMLNRERVSTS